MVLTETAGNLNGPNPVNCDSVVNEAMRGCIGVRQNSVQEATLLEKVTILVSKSVDKVNSVKPKLPFMM